MDLSTLWWGIFHILINKPFIYLTLNDIQWMIQLYISLAIHVVHYITLHYIKLHYIVNLFRYLINIWSKQHFWHYWQNNTLDFEWPSLFSILKKVELGHRLWWPLFIIKINLFFWLGFKSHQHIGYVATFQLYWWKKTSGTSQYIFSGTSRHLSRTTNIL